MFQSTVDRISAGNHLYGCFVGGEWIGEAVVPVIDPASKDCVGKVPNLGSEETHNAIAFAANTFPAWSKLTAKERSRVLRNWFDLIMQHQEALAELLTRENGKPLKEAMAEVAYAASYIEYYAEEAKRVYGETIPSHIEDGRILVLRQPTGVVAAITPWNFPAAMITRKVAPALAVGCTVVVKPAMETPLTALALASLADTAGVPGGALNVITGDAEIIGRALCEDERVRTVTFTGSTRVGKILMAQCASTVKRLGLELGGNAPFIVFDDADIDAAVDGAIASKFRNAGQTCVCANRIYVQSSIYEDFAKKFASVVKSLRVGPGTDSKTDVGPLISPAAVSKAVQHVEDAVDKGARIVIGGSKSMLGDCYFAPTVLLDVNQDMLVAREETFGPVAPLFRFETVDDVIQQANNTPFGLASYFYTRDIGRVMRVAEALEFGMVAVNSGMLSTELAPFGGVKESGQGREGSRHGLDEFTELKYMLLAGI